MRPGRRRNGCASRSCGCAATPNLSRAIIALSISSRSERSSLIILLMSITGCALLIVSEDLLGVILTRNRGAETESPWSEVIDAQRDVPSVRDMRTCRWGESSRDRCPARSYCAQGQRGTGTVADTRRTEHRPSERHHRDPVEKTALRPVRRVPCAEARADHKILCSASRETTGCL